MLKPPRFFSMVRNEVTEKASVPSRQGGVFLADVHRAQLHTLALRDVAYLVRADIAVRPRASGDDPAKYRDQFRRRIESGQCFQTPYLGCREFPAFFGPRRADEQPLDLTEDLGPMLLDLDYETDGGRATPHFFRARLEEGVLRVPQTLYRANGASHAAQ